MDNIVIKKQDGTTEVFKEEKLRGSLERAGANQGEINQVIKYVLSSVKPYTTTGEIYREAFHILAQLPGSSAAKYSLKRAILQLGPSGFPFERFMAKVIAENGYKTRVGVNVEGKCAPHEVDIVAESDSEVLFIEAKFHNKGGVKSDMKVVLYIKSRYDDLKAGGFKGIDIEGKKEDFWLITNTKFTSNAIQYGKCAGLKMIGWSYPKKGNLQDMVENSGLQPLTCLTTLKNNEKETLLNKGIVLCKTILADPNILNSAGISGDRKEAVVKELKGLYQ